MKGGATESAADQIFVKGEKTYCEAISAGNSSRRDQLYGEAFKTLTDAMNMYGELFKKDESNAALVEKLRRCMQLRYGAMKQKRPNSILETNHAPPRHYCCRRPRRPHRPRAVAPDARLVTYPDYSELFKAVQADKVDAITSDSIILLGLARAAGAASTVRLACPVFSTEPYGIAIPEN